MPNVMQCKKVTIVAQGLIIYIILVYILTQEPETEATKESAGNRDNNKLKFVPNKEEGYQDGFFPADETRPIGIETIKYSPDEFPEQLSPRQKKKTDLFAPELTLDVPQNVQMQQTAPKLPEIAERLSKGRAKLAKIGKWMPGSRFEHTCTMNGRTAISGCCEDQANDLHFEFFDNSLRNNELVLDEFVYKVMGKNVLLLGDSIQENLFMGIAEVLQLGELVIVLSYFRTVRSVLPTDTLTKKEGLGQSSPFGPVGDDSQGRRADSNRPLQLQPLILNVLSQNVSHETKANKFPF